jgi:hypothetical protein
MTIGGLLPRRCVGAVHDTRQERFFRIFLRQIGNSALPGRRLNRHTCCYCAEACFI